MIFLFEMTWHVYYLKVGLNWLVFRCHVDSSEIPHPLVPYDNGMNLLCE